MGKSRQKNRMSRGDAEDVMDRARLKEFWAVDDTYDMRRDLLDALDVLFNSVSGNSYDVDYQENQNGTRLIIRCEICSKELTSYDPFITHENGKPHKKIRQQKLTPKDPNIASDLQRRYHNEPKQIFSPGSLEDMLDSTHEIVLGVQFVYKEVLNGTETFTCQLCQRDDDVTRVKKARMFTHITSRKHVTKYLRVKFGYTKKLLGTFEDEAKSIEEIEGKIHTPIVDFTKQLPPNMVGESSANYTPRGPTPRQRSRSRSRSKSRSRHSRSPSRSRRSSSPWSDHSGPRSRSRSSSQSRSKSITPEPAEKLPPPPPPLPPLGPPKPIMCDKEITVDMSEDPKPIEEEINLLQEPECREMLQEDVDMQGLLIQAAWVLNQKLEKYYKKNNSHCVIDGNSVSLVSSADKVSRYICQLNVIPTLQD